MPLLRSFIKKFINIYHNFVSTRLYFKYNNVLVTHVTQNVGRRQLAGGSWQEAVNNETIKKQKYIEIHCKFVHSYNSYFVKNNKQFTP